MNIISTLKAEINTNFPDNTTALITPAKLRQTIKDILDSLNDDQLLEVPIAGATVNITPTKLNTTVRFTGVIADNFTLNVTDSGYLIAGRSTMILIVGGDNTTNAKVITFSGAIHFTQCGSIQPAFVTQDYIQVFPLIWDGQNFTGIDNC